MIISLIISVFGALNVQSLLRLFSKQFLSTEDLMMPSVFLRNSTVSISQLIANLLHPLLIIGFVSLTKVFF